MDFGSQTLKRLHEVFRVDRFDHERMSSELVTFIYCPNIGDAGRSEEHTSELQSPCNLVCRLLLEKKNTVTDVEITGSLRLAGELEFSPADLDIDVAKSVGFNCVDVVSVSRAVFVLSVFYISHTKA